jgi:hypothetical protein
MCASDDDETPSVSTRERDGFEIRLVSVRPECSCGCPEPKNDPAVPGKNAVAPVLEDVCKCVNPELPCYVDHYAGTCGCKCDDGSDCDCNCILLATLKKVDNAAKPWMVDHRVRRFVRPVLMRDPQVEAEEKARKKPVEPPPANPPELAKINAEAQAPINVGEEAKNPDEKAAAKLPKAAKPPKA